MTSCYFGTQICFDAPDELEMTALGQEQTLVHVHAMSALPPKADMVRQVVMVRECATA